MLFQRLWRRRPARPSTGSRAGSTPSPRLGCEPLEERALMSATLSINDVQMSEYWSGVTNLAQFTVRLSEPSDQVVTVNYTTVKGTAGTNDYVSVSGTLTFAPGVTTQYVHVEVNGDDRVEADETFQIHLSGAVNAGLLDAQGIGTILNDDYPEDGSHSDCNGAKKSRTKECQ